MDHRGTRLTLARLFSLVLTVDGLTAGSRATKTVMVGDTGVNGTIVIGYLMDQLKPPYRIGAIGMALHDGQARGLLPGFNFRCAFVRLAHA
jgi:hypothetical protein